MSTKKAATKPKRGRPANPTAPGIDGEIGKRIKAARQANGWPAEELAERSGVSASMIYKAESGGFSLRIQTLDKLAVALGVRPDKLLRGL